MPTMKAPRNTYGLALPSLVGVVKPVQTINTVAIGTSKAMPKAKTMVVMKSRNSVMSVCTSTPSGVGDDEVSDDPADTSDEDADATPESEQLEEAAKIEPAKESS